MGFDEPNYIFLYPRVALAGDQFNELWEYVSSLNQGLVSDGFAQNCIGIALDANQQIGGEPDTVRTKYSHYPGTEVPWIATAANPDRNWSTGKAIGEVYGGQHPAHIIVTNDESFRNRLFAPDVARTDSALNNIIGLVMDEIHLSTHTTAGHHTWLLQRLRQIIPQARFLGVSATIARPRLHVASLWLNDHEGIGSSC